MPVSWPFAPAPVPFDPAERQAVNLAFEEYLKRSAINRPSLGPRGLPAYEPIERAAFEAGWRMGRGYTR